MNSDLTAIKLRLAATLAAAEVDEPAQGEHRAEAIERANAWRARHGIPRLRNDAAKPELGLHERARALGLIR